MDLNKALNREHKRKKEQRKIKRPRTEDKKKDYKNKVLNIRKRREQKEEEVIYGADSIWIDREDNKSRSGTDWKR